MISADRFCSSCGAANSPAAASCFACGLSLKTTLPFLQDDSNYHLLEQRYRILAQLGVGGSSAVYKAEDTLTNNRLVAIKAISLRGLEPQEMIEATDAFNREVLLLSGLKHPSIPRVFHSFSEREGWYVVMDFIEGTTLEKHLEGLAGRQLPTGEVLEIALQLCSVLDYLHSNQPPVVFRDLKPANIMLKPDGRIALIDFGIARHFKPGQARDTMPFGSPGYAAPEQYGKAQTTPRTDIYSLGVILHQLLTGNDPTLTPFRFTHLKFEDESTLAGLGTLIMKMVEINVDKRPESISVVKEELQSIAHEWSAQYSYGLKARNLSLNPHSSTFRLTPIPPFAATGMPVAANGGMQMSLLQSPSGTGSPSVLSPAYRSPPPPQRRPNGMAIASLLLGILCILATLISCAVSGELFYQNAVLISMMMLAPAILAVICGHIGQYRAKLTRGLAIGYITNDGLVIGYLFGALCLVSIIARLFLGF